MNEEERDSRADFASLMNEMDVQWTMSLDLQVNCKLRELGVDGGLLSTPIVASRPPFSQTRDESKRDTVIRPSIVQFVGPCDKFKFRA